MSLYKAVIIMDYIIEKLNILAETGSGIITGKALEESGINRLQLYNLLLSGILIKESHGHYTLSANQPDIFTIIQSRSNKLIFSHSSALYLHGISKQLQKFIDITIPQGDNISRIKKDYQNVIFHYCKKETWEMGIENITTPSGYIVKAYDTERSICDLIKNKANTDTKIYSQSIREYFTGDKYNPERLIKYATALKLEDRVRNYMEILT